ncbi:NAD(P)H-dependent oxidoreductase [Aliagarivorans marinus]|uniref:NAD(P)H-dependent oxidoreductase n=1 Tax=Aliagarivorans marinus TaxID=561965 RepID=UPI0003FB5C6A|nr:NAD(P)H-dependent oxidoreductase [Aliagarivorans marinus]
MSKVLLLFAHPSQDRSEINRPLFKEAKKIAGVTAVDLYAEYPSFRINVDREQQRLREHQVVIFMFPLYWYSTPAILKEWQDLVLEYGFAYGSEGKELQGKTFLCSLTAGGAASAYRKGGYNHYQIWELLRPLEQTANLTGMHYLPPFALFGSRTAVDEGRLPEHIQHWRSLLEALVSDSLAIEHVAPNELLNHQLEQIIKEGA